MTSEQNNSNMKSVVGELVLSAIILYFAWQAGPMIDYMQKLIPHFLAKDKDTMSHVMGYIYLYGGNCLLALTILLPLSALFSDAEAEAEGMAFFLIVWAALGWWIGRSFEQAYAAKIACKQASTFGFGCSLNSPVISHLAFCALGIIIALFTFLFLLSSIFGESENGSENSGKQG